MSISLVNLPSNNIYDDITLQIYRTIVFNTRRLTTLLYWLSVAPAVSGIRGADEQQKRSSVQLTSYVINQVLVHQ